MTKKSILWILPFLILNGVVIFAALFKSIQMSLGYYPLIGMKTLTLDYFQSVLKNALYLKSIRYSLYLALISTAGALLIGLILAFVLLKIGSKHPFLSRLFEVPITIPHLIVALMLMLMLTQSGLFSRIGYNLGLIHQIDQFPLLVHDQWGFSIILVFLYKEIPYVAVAMLAILKQMDLSYIQVARNLGANSRQTFTKVVLPMIQPTLVTLFIILFCFTFSSFEVPFILGSPSQQTVAVTVYDLFTQADLRLRPQAFALNLVLSAICLAVTGASLWLSSKLPGGKGRY